MNKILNLCQCTVPGRQSAKNQVSDIKHWNLQIFLIFQREPIYHIIQRAQDFGRESLKKSEYTRTDLNEQDPAYDPEIFDVRIWKDGLITWAIEAIEKRSKKPNIAKIY